MEHSYHGKHGRSQRDRLQLGAAGSGKFHLPDSFALADLRRDGERCSPETDEQRECVTAYAARVQQSA